MRYEELFHERVCLAVAPNHPFARRRSVPLTDAVCEPFIALTAEGYPVYYDYLLAIFAPVKQKPRVVEEHDSYSGVLSAVEAGTGVAIGVDVSFGNCVKLLRLTPEPKPIALCIAARKDKLGLAAEKFWQCAREAAASK